MDGRPSAASAKARRTRCALWLTEQGGQYSQGRQPSRGGHFPLRRHAARRRRRPRSARRDPSQGHRQRRHQGTLRAASQDGHQTVMITGDNQLTAAAIAAEAGVDDFSPQAKPEDKLAHPPRTSGRPPGRHDRRRHERRPGAGPGRRRRGHEHRHAGRQRGRQHGRPRLQPDQAPRDRRNRQTTAHHARLAHDLQHRQRRGEIFRHHSGDADGHVPGHRAAQHHATCTARPARS